MKIFLDMDGVVADFMGGCCALYQLDPNKDMTLRNFLANSERMEGSYFGTTKEIDQKILDAHYNFWGSLKILPHALELYSESCELVGKRNVFFLTNAGRFHAGAWAKLDWLDSTFGKGTSKYHIITKFKELLARPDRILVDDLSQNIARWKESGGIGLQFPNQYLIDTPRYAMNWNKFKENLNAAAKSP